MIGIFILVPKIFADNCNQIKFTFSDQTVLATLADNSAAKELYKKLPFTVSFSDFHSEEKIAYLPNKEKLDVSNIDGCAPNAGDITIYAPWGNIAIFYVSIRYNSDLKPIGILESGGSDKFKAQTNDFEVVISKAETTTKCPSFDTHKKLSTGEIVGIVLGCVGFIVMIILIIVVFKKFKKDKQEIEGKKSG